MMSSTPNLGKDQELEMIISWSHLLWNRKCSTPGQCQEFSSQHELTRSSSTALRNRSTIRARHLTSCQHQKQKACPSTTRRSLRLRSASMGSGSCVHLGLRSSQKNQLPLRNKVKSSEQEAWITKLLSATINTRHGKSSRARWRLKTTRLSFAGRSTQRELSSLMTRPGWWNRQWLRIGRGRNLSQESWSTESESSLKLVNISLILMQK